ncbi:hypothetical protein F5Y10DRAFT_276075 [Nemania abortiva]|nr:hypothetical protein F5Y10DRAFT_276075 [Nemania abortiva]
MNNTDSIISWLDTLIPGYPGCPSKGSHDATNLDTTKHLLDLQLEEFGVEINALNLDALPATARKLVSSMEKIRRGHEILPHALESTIRGEVEGQGLEYHLWRYSFKPPEEVDRLPGRIPTFKEVEKLCRDAIECDQYGHEETSWNSLVRLPLLRSVCKGTDGQYHHLDAMSCTTARLHQDFKPASSLIKMIDICVYAPTNQDADLSAKIVQFSRITPTCTVNHTDFFPISTRPLLLSIATTKPGIRWEMAQLQMGIWHVAQWAFIRWAVAQKLVRDRIQVGIETQPQIRQDDLDVKVLAVLSKLEFIPGVIIQDHRWYLVLSTYEDGKTKLWVDCRFGTTGTCLGTYSTIAGIRQLMAWARDVYMPWFKTNILDGL